VVIAVASAGVMQVTADQVVHMIAVRHCRVPAIRSVLVSSIVACARMRRRARGGVHGAHVNVAFINMPVVRAMQMAPWICA
jgi:hypothetical protein